MLLYGYITTYRLLRVPCGREEEVYEDEDNNNSVIVTYGILPDTGAANVSTVGREQYLALTREDLTVTIDISMAGKASIKFGKGSIRKINFKVLKAPTPFLLCLVDIDRLNVYFNNTTDKLVQGEHRTLVIRK
ncbi:hypothetical protein BU23DRAFT_580811 [Bimuria novae-zelandiae CBS 107.79]|uniref:Uncharacterized protein n=1 Tax=Bimuria novae-zelandiae CBS 107.79 TaxID=1447943 RepID=A0A6A5V7T5_9PLEO|nr:hypothetical protein BU23DRAFT_580811 [Bimuria novae-zelandiae CBS 107.79]